ncbi:MAG: ketol-acid reductoisomerase [Planctomycetota bacterium]
MKTKIFYEADAAGYDLNGKLVAVVGYGAQGQAHALNLRDSGCEVTVAARPGGRGWKEAERDGFQPKEVPAAVAGAAIVCLMMPDEVHGEVFRREILPHASRGFTALTCHGFSFHYNLVSRDQGYHRLLVAPKGQGHMVRGEYLQGGGVPCLIATDPGEEQEILPLGLAYARALGGTKAGVIQTTIAAETETDLFGEQAVLCGGLTSLVQAGFDTLVEAGYQPELAYFECLHELKIIVDLLHAKGVAAMRDVISTTAEYGDLTRGPRIIDQHVRRNMRQILDEIQSGSFAREFLAAQKEGGQLAQQMQQEVAGSLLETTGKELRGMMPWLKRKS